MIEISDKDLPINANMYSPLVLAYMGDVVFELLVRQKIVLKANMPVNALHKQTIQHVCAKAQSNSLELIMDMLTEKEISIFKRGRNANGSHVPKNSDPADYRRATGFEALFGYLYLTAQHSRINELFEFLWEKTNM